MRLGDQGVHLCCFCHSCHMNKRDTNTEGVVEFPSATSLASLAPIRPAKWALQTVGWYWQYSVLFGVYHD
jgi:hypothetical protein